MCPGGACKLKNVCYRFVAECTDKDEQTFFSAPPFADDDTCRFFWEVRADAKSTKPPAPEPD